MRLIPPLLILALAAALAGCSKKADDLAAAKPAAPVAPVAPPPGKAWVDTVAATPDGGYLVGNSSAPVKIVEYGAFTCPHCKRFETEGAPKLLADYVPTGKVSYEFRPMAIHGPADVVASLLVACRGPEPYFTLSQQIYAYQDEYLNKLQPFLTANGERLQAMAPADQFRELAKAGGLYAFFGARGLTTAKIDACLADKPALDSFTAAQEKAAALGVNSTPSFLLNGRLLDKTDTWEQLQAVLKTALG